MRSNIQPDGISGAIAPESNDNGEANVYQKLILIGHLGQDPEMRYMPNGTPVTSFSMATGRKYTAPDGKTCDETLWFRVAVWGKQAEPCNQFLTKGSRVIVEGVLVGDENGGPRIWTGQDGKPRASFEVRAMVVRFLSRGARGSQNGAERPKADPMHAGTGEMVTSEDELPF